MIAGDPQRFVTFVALGTPRSGLWVLDYAQPPPPARVAPSSDANGDVMTADEGSAFLGVLNTAVDAL